MYWTSDQKKITMKIYMQIRDILKGKYSTVIDHLKNLMRNIQKNCDLKRPRQLKEKIEILSRFRSRSAVVSNTIKNVDVFAFTQESDNAYVNYLKSCSRCCNSGIYS